MSMAPEIEAPPEPLLAVARPDVYRLNPFRILGLPVTSTERDLRKQAETLQMAEKFGNTPQIAAGPLPLDPAPLAEATRDATQLLQDPEGRLVAELFWLWPMGAAGHPDQALAALIRQDFHAAAAVWKKAQEQPQLREIATHNLAVLYHAVALDLEQQLIETGLDPEQNAQRRLFWAEALTHWRTVSQEQDWTWLRQRVRDLDDPRLTGDSVDQLKRELPTILLMISSQLAVRAADRGDKSESEFHARMVFESGFSADESSSATRLAVQPIRSELTHLCRQATEDAKADPERADQIVRQLVKRASSLLATLDQLLPPGNELRTAAHDEAAQSAKVCQVEFSRKTEDWATARELIDLIIPLASSASVRALLSENRETVVQNWDFERDFLKCWFCRENKAEDSYRVGVRMYGDVVRTHGFGGTRATYKNLTVPVPRCSNCAAVHKNSNSISSKGCLFTAVAAIILAIISYVIFAADNLGTFLVSLAVILGLSVVAAIVLFVVAKKSRPEGVEPVSEAHYYTEVKRMISEGWEIGNQPSN